MIGGLHCKLLGMRLQKPASFIKNSFRYIGDTNVWALKGKPFNDARGIAVVVLKTPFMEAP